MMMCRSQVRATPSGDLADSLARRRTFEKAQLSLPGRVSISVVWYKMLDILLDRQNRPSARLRRISTNGQSDQTVFDSSAKTGWLIGSYIQNEWKIWIPGLRLWSALAD
jgi:hypothetical protein